MIEIKYFYFEKNSVILLNRTISEPKIENENVLLLKPHTNSHGIMCDINL